MIKRKDSLQELKTTINFLRLQIQMKDALIANMIRTNEVKTQ